MLAHSLRVGNPCPSTDTLNQHIPRLPWPHLQVLSTRRVPIARACQAASCQTSNSADGLHLPGNCTWGRGLLQVIPNSAPKSSNSQHSQCRTGDWRADFLCSEAMTSQRSGNTDSNCSLKKERSCDYSTPRQACLSLIHLRGSRVSA